MRRHALQIVIGAGFLLLFGCQNLFVHHAKHEFFRMATLIEVTIVSQTGDARMRPIWNSIDSLLAFWEMRYSQTNPR
jgi:hypothetical protein